jgi:predicted metal-dependent phosphoesterase TrpH
MIDLHCHSTASDGTCSPSELITLAKNARLSALALTDHDTTAGLPEFLEAAKAQDFDGIPGIELAGRDQRQHSFHILGLFIQPDHPGLLEITQQILQWRNERNYNIIAKLNQLGLDISLADIEECCDGDVLGRPHIAQALIRKKICRTVKQAFDKIIGRGCEAYVSRQVPTPEECIRVIHAAGGLAIWAHPYSSDSMTNSRCRELAAELKEQGLDGIEAYYSLHRQPQTLEALKIARELNLLVTGGSDFHGSHFPKLNLGSGYGRLEVPDSLLIPLREKAAAHFLSTESTESAENF